MNFWNLSEWLYFHHHPLHLSQTVQSHRKLNFIENCQNCMFGNHHLQLFTYINNQLFFTLKEEYFLSFKIASLCFILLFVQADAHKICLVLFLKWASFLDAWLMKSHFCWRLIAFIIYPTYLISLNCSTYSAKFIIS